MTTTTTRKTTTRYEVRYVGAPYGLNESGETVSRHRTLEAAQKARRDLQFRSAKYYGSNSRIVRVENGEVVLVEA